MNEEQIVDEAARWVIQILDDPAPRASTEFAGWLVRSGDHVRAYLRLSRMWLIPDLTFPVRAADELLDILRERVLRSTRPTTSVE